MENNLLNKDQRRIDWITMFLLVANSANPFFFQSIEMLFLSFLFLILLWYVKKGEATRLNKYFWIYMGALLTLQLAQSLVYHLFPIKTFLGEYLRIAFAMLALKILGDTFFDRFVKFVYVFAVISLCFYIPCVLIKGLAPFLINNVAKYTLAPFVNNFEGLYNSRENLIIFNLSQIQTYRNSGFYWEPGSHGGFLILALFINLFYRKEDWKSRYNKIFFITILTTLSTTTYLALFLVLLVYLKDFFVRRPALSLFFFLSIIGGALLLYNKLSFLQNKIDKQIAYSHKGDPGESRFNSFLADMKTLNEHPYIGSGRNSEMKFGKTFYNVDPHAKHRNNGVGVLLGTYGFFFFCLFLYLSWLSYYKALQDRPNAVAGVAVLLLIAFSEDYFFKPFFIAWILYCGVTVVSAESRTIIRSKKMKLGKNILSHE